MQLRPYQSKIISQSIDLYKEDNYVYMQMPTGTGKTFTAIKLIQELKAKRVLWLVGSAELVKQTQKIAPDNFDVMTWQYFYRNPTTNYDFLVIDEIHFGGKSKASLTFNKIFKSHKEKRRLYISASPWNLNFELLGPIENHLAAYYIEDAYQDGNLPDLEMHQLRVGKQDEVKTIEAKCKKNFTFLESLEETELTKFLNSHNLEAPIIADSIHNVLKNRIDFLLEEYQKNNSSQQAILFTPNTTLITYAKKILKENKITHTSVSYRNKQNTKEHLNLFQSGKVKIMVACNMLNFGFDMPSLSLALDSCYSTDIGRNYQKIGRLLRKYPNKHSVKYIYTRDLKEDEDCFSPLVDTTQIFYCDRNISPKEIQDIIQKKKKNNDSAPSFSSIKNLAIGAVSIGSANFANIKAINKEQRSLEEKKNLIIQLALKKAPRPNRNSKDPFEKELARVLIDYTGSGRFFDFAFDHFLKNNAPKTWFKTKTKKNFEQLLLDRAKENKPKPSQHIPEEKALYKALQKILLKNPQFKEQLPDSWFITPKQIVKEKKQQLLQILQTTSQPPKHLKQALKDYTNHKSKMYDPLFTQQIKTLRNYK